MLTACLKANASHMAGADISYTNLGNDLYKVNYTLYSDCSGSLPPVSMNATVRSNNCVFTRPFLLQKVTGSEIVISPNCSSAPSTCNGGVNSGFRQIEYSGTIVLTERCNDIVFSVTDCCRNSAITSVTNPESLPLYVEARLNNLTGTNSSPLFSGKPIMVLNTNQENYLSLRSFDSDGDSLVYNLIAPKTSESTTVNYASGYDAQHFITSNSLPVINHDNGTIIINPSQQETVIMAVKISEFRNGELIGTAMRDVQLISSNSNNTLPSIPQLEIDPLNTFSVCKGEDLLLNLTTTDANAGQMTVVEITSNIPDLDIQKTTDQFQKAQIKWTARDVQDNSGLWIKVQVSDNACPMNGVKIYFLEIKVSSLEFSPVVTNSDCAGKNNGSIALNISDLSMPVSVDWTNSSSSQFVLTELTAGIYSVTLDNGKGCSMTRNFQVVDKSKLEISSTIEKASCEGNDGQVFLLPEGGTLPYRIMWNDNSDLQDRYDLAAGLYQVQISDANGCTLSTSLKVEKEECETVDPEFRIFPNPASEFVTIQNDFLSANIESFTITDATGKTVLKKIVMADGSMNEIILLENFSKGLYFVTLSSATGNKVLRFVKK
ncbi:MAG: T9SS type A sorting domain-containing protein [Bacteroidota bacterium]